MVLSKNFRRKMKRRLTPLFVAIITIFLFFDNSFGGVEEIRVKGVEIKGNRRIETGTIKSKIRAKEGDIFSMLSLREDLKTIHSMGYFQDVRIETEDFEGGLKVIFIVEEKPFVVEVNIEGNEELTTDKLKEKITITAYTFIDERSIKENTEKIRLYYEEEGFYHVRIIPVIKTLAPDKVSLLFFIEEGKKVSIKEIRFEGNKAITDRRLKKVMKTKKKWLLSWLDGSGVYKKEEALTDVERVRELYLDNGYIEVQVSEPRISLSEDKRWIVLNISFSEGAQYKIKNINIKGSTIFSTSDLLKKFELKPGDIFNRGVFRKDMTTVSDMYGEKGYVFMDVTPQFFPEQDTKLLNIDINIEEKNKVKVGKINILGNEATRDKVIRREIRLNEQETINTKALKRSYQRLNNLNFFESLEITTGQVDRETLDLNIRVKDKPTGSFSIGGGYSSIDRWMGQIEISEGNLFGRGQLLKARGEFSSRRTNYSLTFREPWLLDTPTSGTISLFDNEREYYEYKRKNRGFSLGLGRSFKEYYGGNIGYTWEKVKIFDVQSAASQRIKDEEAKGEQLTSNIALTLYRDTRDNFLDPHKGSENTVSVEYAGGYLGGDNAFGKYVYSTSWYFPLFWNTVIMFRGKVGYAEGLWGKELPLNERFFVGGINTVRGFDFGEAAKDKDLGGNKELIFNIEYSLPLVPEAMLKGVLFFDAGYAFDNDEGYAIGKLRYSAGGGFRWISPIGPLRLEWGYNLDPEPGEKQSRWDFSIGTFF